MMRGEKREGKQPRHEKDTIMDVAGVIGLVSGRIGGGRHWTTTMAVGSDSL